MQKSQNREDLLSQMKKLNEQNYHKNILLKQK